MGGENSELKMAMGNITVADYSINTKSALTMSREIISAPIVMEPYRCDNIHHGHGFCHFAVSGYNRTILIREDEADS